MDCKYIIISINVILLIFACCNLPIIYVVDSYIKDKDTICIINNSSHPDMKYRNKIYRILIDVDTFVLLCITLLNILYLYSIIYKLIYDIYNRFNYYFSFIGLNVLLIIRCCISTYLYINKCYYNKAWINNIIIYIMLFPYVMLFISLISLILIYVFNCRGVQYIKI